MCVETCNALHCWYDRTNCSTAFRRNAAVLQQSLLDAYQHAGPSLAVPCYSLLLRSPGLAQVDVVGRFDSWQLGHGPFTGKVAVLRRLVPAAGMVGVKDVARFVETMHMFAIHHYLTVSCVAAGSTAGFTDLGWGTGRCSMRVGASPMTAASICCRSSALHYMNVAQSVLAVARM